MSRFVFGCLQLGGYGLGNIDENKVIEAANTAIDMGLDIFDTAPIYGLGHSEEVLGKIVQGKRSRIKIATKVGLVWCTNNGFKKYIDNSAESIISSVEDSLKRLSTDYIDICLLHYPDILTPLDETMEAMYKMKKDGKILEAGYCNLDLKELKKAIEIGNIIAQIPFNLIDKEPVNEFIPFCKSHGIKIMAHSPLARGFLTGKYNSGSKFNDNDRRRHDPYIKNKYLDKIADRIKIIAQKYDLYSSQVALQWVVSKDVDHVIFGVKDSQQLLCNMESLKTNISKRDLRFLEEYD